MGKLQNKFHMFPTQFLRKERCFEDSQKQIIGIMIVHTVVDVIVKFTVWQNRECPCYMGGFRARTLWIGMRPMRWHRCQYNATSSEINYKSLRYFTIKVRLLHIVNQESNTSIQNGESNRNHSKIILCSYCSWKLQTCLLFSANCKTKFSKVHVKTV